MTARWTIPAFSAYGIELEYAIVDRHSLAVRPIAADLLRAFAGNRVSDVERGPLGWSNELAAHVIELKNLAPTADLKTLPLHFQSEIRAANRALEPLSACLMPTGMHPWMEPSYEAVLWQGENRGIYEAYDQIFDCRRHGWSNVQSMHINLPFADDKQFARLHAAVRLVLPLLPALAASSPIVEARETGMMDYRLELYRTHARRVPTLSGKVIPETVVDRAEYEERILDPMYEDIKPLDPDGILCHEWLNCRGAIARFDRNAIEIRLADTQECPEADIAIAAATCASVAALYLEAWSSLRRQQAIATQTLAPILRACARAGEDAIIDDRQFLEVVGMKSRRCRAGDIWQHLIQFARSDSGQESPWWYPRVVSILDRGTLARRIVRAVGGEFTRERLRDVYGELCVCLDDGIPFH